MTCLQHLTQDAWSIMQIQKNRNATLLFFNCHCVHLNSGQSVIESVTFGQEVIAMSCPAIDPLLPIQNWFKGEKLIFITWSTKGSKQERKVALHHAVSGHNCHLQQFLFHLNLVVPLCFVTHMNVVKKYCVYLMFISKLILLGLIILTFDTRHQLHIYSWKMLHISEESCKRQLFNCSWEIEFTIKMVSKP